MGLINPGVGLIHSSASGGIAFEVLPAPGPPAHPFFVTLLKVSGAWHFKVTPGTINSLVPFLETSPLDANPAPTKALGSASGYVYIECKYTAGAAFPVPADLKVMYDTTVPTDSDTMSHVALAYIDFSGTNPKKTAQYVSTSLWGERLKCGSNPAEYFFCRA